jgi:hypothetical protein
MALTRFSFSLSIKLSLAKNLNIGKSTVLYTHYFIFPINLKIYYIWHSALGDTDSRLQREQLQLKSGVQKALYKGGYRWCSMKYRSHSERVDRDGAVRSTEGTGQWWIQIVQYGVQRVCAIVDTYDAVQSTEVRVQGWIQIV